MSIATIFTNNGQVPSGPWPSDGLERVESCPVCGGTRRDPLYESLTDRVFRCVPGKWTLYICRDCRSAFLDPRPTPAAIHLAYKNYYTHEPTKKAEAHEISQIDFIKISIRNDYLKARFGVTLYPRLPLGVFLVYMLPYRRLQLNRSTRYLVPYEKNSKLLDIGCGNGGFVRFASSVGWDAQGLEPDYEAVAAARKTGIKVIQGGFPYTGLADGQFDAVTMSHVIEHVYDPIAALREVHRILKPGGRVFIATPNLDSDGHRLFKCHWRGLEPPRHLVLFNASSLRLVCERAGFVDAVFRRPSPHDSAWYFMASSRILRDQDFTSVEGERLPMWLKWRARWMDLKTAIMPEKGEELALIAAKSWGDK